MSTENYKFFRHEACESFPCHKTDNPDEFNCLFCYCPLYALGEKCGGNFKLTDRGIKDCSDCLVPHRKNNYDYIIGRFEDIKKLTGRMLSEKDKKESENE
ncbi:MAG: cysteine-rich small domain-containing protein [Oscillospiraceae bacterium]|nr:cysteine-rich small domain-containing protein [Oscillospiraceae bacterium]